MKNMTIYSFIGAIASILSILFLDLAVPAAHAQDSVTLQFQNKTGRQVRVYWMNFQNKPKLYRQLGPGQSYNQVTGVLRVSSYLLHQNKR